MRRLLLGVLLATGALAQSVPDASTQFAQILKQVKEARQKKDMKAVLSSSLELAKLLHYSGPATEQMAMVYAEMGDQQGALQALHEFVAMGQCDDDVASRPQFGPLKSLPEFQQLLKEMDANRSPVERGVEIAKFQDPGLVPEDIDYDGQNKSFLVTSVLEKKIVRISMNGAQKDFAKGPDDWPMLAIKVDSRRNIVWATEVALNNFVEAPSKDWGRSVLLCLQLKDGSLIGRIDSPHTALGDMTLTANGDLIVSDNDGGGVYRVRADLKNADLERVDGGQFIAPQTPVAEPDGQHVFVPDYVRGVGVLDLRNKQVRWIEANRRHAMQGIDGLYFTQGMLIATQNGASPERVVVFGLDAQLQEVASERVLERSTEGDFTHGVFVGRDFYYITNAGWNSLDDNGRLKPGAKMKPAVIRKTALGER